LRIKIQTKEAAGWKHRCFFCLIDASTGFDETIKTIRSVMPDWIRHPEVFEITIFQVKPGMTKKANFNFLRSHQLLILS